MIHSSLFTLQKYGCWKKKKIIFSIITKKRREKKKEQKMSYILVERDTEKRIRNREKRESEIRETWKESREREI